MQRGDRRRHRCGRHRIAVIKKTKITRANWARRSLPTRLKPCMSLTIKKKPMCMKPPTTRAQGEQVHNRREENAQAQEASCSIHSALDSPQGWCPAFSFAPGLAASSLKCGFWPLLTSEPQHSTQEPSTFIPLAWSLPALKRKGRHRAALYYLQWGM